jgi:Na+-transporting NADH:ubiquinone oxidoreductase subunit NqrE
MDVIDHDRDGLMRPENLEKVIEKFATTEKTRVSTADVAFVAFIVIITAIAAMVTFIQIYLQNPK